MHDRALMRGCARQTARPNKRLQDMANEWLDRMVRRYGPENPCTEGEETPVWMPPERVLEAQIEHTKSLRELLDSQFGKDF